MNGPVSGRPSPRSTRDQLIYVSFGSIAASIGLFPHLYAAVLDALADTPARVLVTLGSGADPAELSQLPPNSHVEWWWPQEQVMPHATLVVSHGGAGTTLAALTAGVPQVLVPLFAFDQFQVALRVSEVGIGAVEPSRNEGTQRRRAETTRGHGRYRHSGTTRLSRMCRRTRASLRPWAFVTVVVAALELGVTFTLLGHGTGPGGGYATGGLFGSLTVWALVTGVVVGLSRDDRSSKLVDDAPVV